MLSPGLKTELDKRKLSLVIAGEVEAFPEKADMVTLPSWPEFMLHDAVANKYWAELNVKHADFQYALVEKGSNKWVSVGNSIPVRWSGLLTALPDAGWDWALSSGMESGQLPNLLCALSIQILPLYRNQGLSTIMIQIMREIGTQFGFDQLIAPVRPSKKSDYPLLPMETYIEWSKDHQRFDPWLRVHERLGARVLKVCPQAMKISGTVQEWQDWTGLSFRSSAEYIIPGALNPVKIDIENDLGVYVEPNVWMLHSSDE
ncbi:hypothetical protein HQ531_12085 [bacterium]|nr:hypothetical protein [bacterium]